MDSSTYSLLGTSLATWGSVIATGTGWYNGNFGALNTLGASGFSLAAVSGFGVTNLSSIVGINFTAPSNFLGNVTSFRLSSGICQAVKQL